VCGCSITLTLPIIESARRVVFMAGGAEKAPVLRQVLAQARGVPAPADAFPSQMVHAAAKQIDWFVDAGACPPAAVAL
jgi:6-phosphogluconolactonase/glucosamine-6-phosphate isomerase/deaminase